MLVNQHSVTVPLFKPKPIAAEPVPQNPWMAPNGRSNMHGDAYMSDTYTWPGPGGGRLNVGFKALGGETASVAFDRAGRLIAVCIYPSPTTIRRSVLILDPVTLDVLASLDLPKGGGGSTGFGGGGYIYLNQDDQAVIPTANQQLWIVSTAQEPPALTLAGIYDLAGAIGDTSASILSALPDWSGRLWWVTDTGVVGYTDTASGASWTYKLPAPQVIGNSFAVDETGGVFIASNYAMYRFDTAATGEIPAVTWCYAYDHGVREKPGQHNFGSGTTPTLVGSRYCGITDNADPHMHVVVYRREADVAGSRIVAQVPVFPSGHSDTENSLIGYTGNFIVENNYGYSGSTAGVGDPITPGIARVHFGDLPSGGHKVWENEKLVVPSVVSKLSLASGLLYTYTRDIKDGRHDWNVTAVDVETGELVWKVLAGKGPVFDNHYSALYVSPAGTIYVPVALGMVILTADPA